MKPKVRKCREEWRANRWTVENAPNFNSAATWESAFLHALNVASGYRLDELWDGHPIKIGNVTMQSGKWYWNHTVKAEHPEAVIQ